MPRQIGIEFAQRKVKGIATLLEEEAPRTCQAVWNALPLEAGANHARWLGRGLREHLSREGRGRAYDHPSGREPS